MQVKANGKIIYVWYLKSDGVRKWNYKTQNCKTFLFFCMIIKLQRKVEIFATTISEGDQQMSWSDSLKFQQNMNQR